MRSWVALALIGLLATGSMASEEYSVKGGRYIAKEYFGLHIRYGTTRTPFPLIRFGGWRLITPETEWRGVQPHKGDWNLGHIDRAVDLAAANGVEIVLTLGQTPLWAASRPDEVVPNGPGASSEPSDIRDWENYVRTVSRRYRGKIKYYELWNEPRFLEVDPYRKIPGFTGTARQLVQLGAVARQVLAEEDPSALLISPGFDAGFAGLRRVDQWFRSGGGAVASVLGYHFYLRPPEKMGRLYRDLREITRRHGYPEMPIWNTESGYFVDNPERPVLPHYPGTDYVFAEVLSPDKLAAFMVRAHIISAAAGVGKFYWYSWDILDMGLTRSYGREQTVASIAYATMLRWLRGSVIHSCRTLDDVNWRCDITRQGRRAHLVWNVAGDNDLAIPGDMVVSMAEYISGEVRRVVDGRLTVGISPVLLRDEKAAWLVQD